MAGEVVNNMPSDSGEDVLRDLVNRGTEPSSTEVRATFKWRRCLKFGVRLSHCKKLPIYLLRVFEECPQLRNLAYAKPLELL